MQTRLQRNVPAYLRQRDFSEAPPGHRFSIYWPGEERRHSGEGLADTCSDLAPHSRAALEALRLRQEVIAAAAHATAWSRAFELTAPFITGLGNEHPNENGFAFLMPHGLPYLAGSGVKGVLRCAATELAEGKWGGNGGWSMEAVNTLFGVAVDPEADEPSDRGLLQFWDVFFVPERGTARLQTEIMTPHMAHYLQPGAGRQDTGSSPHPHGIPNPITFLAVPAGWQCTLHVLYVPRRGHRALDGSWRELLDVAVDLATEWLGFGAKTAVGYGRWSGAGNSRQALKDRLLEVGTADRKASREASRSSRNDRQRRIDAFVEACEALAAGGRLEEQVKNKGPYQLATQLASQSLADGSDWTADDRGELAAVLEEWLPRVIRNFDVKRAKADIKFGKLKGQV